MLVTNEIKLYIKKNLFKIDSYIGMGKQTASPDCLGTLVVFLNQF